MSVPSTPETTLLARTQRNTPPARQSLGFARSTDEAMLELVRDIAAYRALRMRLLVGVSLTTADVVDILVLEERLRRVETPVDLREFFRFDCALPALLVHASGEACAMVLVENISAGGARVAFDPGLHAGEVVRLTVGFATGDFRVTFEFGARVAWVGASSAGLMFAGPVDVLESKPQ